MGGVGGGVVSGGADNLDLDARQSCVVWVLDVTDCDDQADESSPRDTDAKFGTVARCGSEEVS